MSDTALEDLPFDELRTQAFHLAEKRLDVVVPSFFYVMGDADR